MRVDIKVPMQPEAWRRAAPVRPVPFYDTQKKVKRIYTGHYINCLGDLAGDVAQKVVAGSAVKLHNIRFIHDFNKHSQAHKVACDIDNLIKLHLDAGKGTLWKDDRHIVSISHAEKALGYPPEISFTVEYL